MAVLWGFKWRYLRETGFWVMLVGMRALNMDFKSVTLSLWTWRCPPKSQQLESTPNDRNGMCVCFLCLHREPCPQLGICFHKRTRCFCPTMCFISGAQQPVEPPIWSQEGIPEASFLCAGVRKGWFVVWAQGTQTELRIDCQTFNGNERSR